MIVSNRQHLTSICIMLPVSSPNNYGIIAKALVKRGLVVTIIVLSSHESPPIEKLQGANIININTRGIFYSPFRGLLNPLTIILITAKAIKTKACIFWGRGYSLLPSMLILKLINRRVIYHIGDDDIANMIEVANTRYHMTHLSHVLRILMQYFERLLITKANYVITHTESLKADRQRYTNAIQAIYYATSTDYSTDNVESNIKAKLQNKIVAVYSGTIALQKGFLEIISAYKIVKSEIPNIALLFVGGILPLE